jgi:hypothetical protein
MPERIYMVSPDSRTLSAVEAVGFLEIGVRERTDLERWVTAHPNLLGEDLLIITTEFDRFDRSSKRLDLLALDADSKLVVVELKLDAAGTLADLQAIRYAAFCSTMTTEDIVQLLATFSRCSEEDARKKILDFLRAEELPDLDDRPRIILAAGSMDDEEITSCVLWLRNFGGDITCMELTPFRLVATGQTLLVPRVIIPLPEAKDYLVQVERKEVDRGQKATRPKVNVEFWATIGEVFGSLGLPFKTTGRGSSGGNYMQIAVGIRALHYEWLIRKSMSYIGIALHSESSDEQRNHKIIEAVLAYKENITQGVPLEFATGKFGRKWEHVEFRLPYEGEYPNPSLAPRAAEVMKLLIERTWPIVQSVVKK